MNELPNEIDSVDMITCYDTYFRHVQPLASIIGQSTENYYPLGMMLGFDDQIWIVFRSGCGGIVYRKLSPSQTESMKLLIQEKSQI